MRGAGRRTVGRCVVGRRAVERDAAEPVGRVESRRQTGLTEAVQDAFRPCDVHSAGQVPVGRHEPVERTAPQAEASGLGRDLRRVAGVTEQFDQGRPKPEPARAGPGVAARLESVGLATRAGDSSDGPARGGVGATEEAVEGLGHQEARPPVVALRQRDAEIGTRSPVELGRPAGARAAPPTQTLVLRLEQARGDEPVQMERREDSPQLIPAPAAASSRPTGSWRPTTKSYSRRRLRLVPRGDRCDGISEASSRCPWSPI